MTIMVACADIGDPDGDSSWSLSSGRQRKMVAMGATITKHPRDAPGEGSYAES